MSVALDTEASSKPPADFPNYRRRYSDHEKAAALARLEANGGRLNETAAELGIPRITLADWSYNRGCVPAVRELAEVYKQALADKYEEIANRVLASVDDESIERASLLQRVTSAAIATDKMRLLREQATSIQRNEQMSDSERVARLMALLTQEPTAIEVQPMAGEEQPAAHEQERAPAHESNQPAPILPGATVMQDTIEHDAD